MIISVKYIWFSWRGFLFLLSLFLFPVKLPGATTTKTAAGGDENSENFDKALVQVDLH